MQQNYTLANAFRANLILWTLCCKLQKVIASILYFDSLRNSVSLSRSTETPLFIPYCLFKTISCVSLMGIIPFPRSVIPTIEETCSSRWETDLFRLKRGDRNRTYQWRHYASYPRLSFSRHEIALTRLSWAMSTKLTRPSKAFRFLSDWPNIARLLYILPQENTLW